MPSLWGIILGGGTIALGVTWVLFGFQTLLNVIPWWVGAPVLVIVGALTIWRV